MRKLSGVFVICNGRSLSIVIRLAIKNGLGRS